MQHGYPVPPFSWKRHAVSLTPLFLTLLTLLLLHRSELATVHYFRAHRDVHPLSTRVMQSISDWGLVAFYAVYVALLARAALRHIRCDMNFLLSFVRIFALTLLTVYIFKGFFGRARPYFEGGWAGFFPFSWEEDFYSFPSGHTTQITALAGTLAQRYRHWGMALATGLAIAAVGYSRVYLGMHYFTDVLGGMVAGTLASFYSWRLFRRGEQDDMCIQQPS